MKRGARDPAMRADLRTRRPDPAPPRGRRAPRRAAAGRARREPQRRRAAARRRIAAARLRSTHRYTALLFLLRRFPLPLPPPASAAPAAAAPRPPPSPCRTRTPSRIAARSHCGHSGECWAQARVLALALLLLLPPAADAHGWECGMVRWSSWGRGRSRRGLRGQRSV